MPAETQAPGNAKGPKKALPRFPNPGPLEAKKATPAQLRRAKELRHWWAAFRLDIRQGAKERAGVSDDQQKGYDKRSFAFAIYAVWASQQVYDAVQKKGDSKSYELFFSLMEPIQKGFHNGMLYTSPWDLPDFKEEYERQFSESYHEIQGKLEECSKHLGTPHYKYKRILNEFDFLLQRLVGEVRKRHVWAPKEGDTADEPPWVDYVPGL